MKYQTDYYYLDFCSLLSELDHLYSVVHYIYTLYIKHANVSLVYVFLTAIFMIISYLFSLLKKLPIKLLSWHLLRTENGSYPSHTCVRIFILSLSGTYRSELSRRSDVNEMCAH